MADPNKQKRKNKLELVDFIKDSKSKKKILTPTPNINSTISTQPTTKKLPTGFAVGTLRSGSNTTSTKRKIRPATDR
jgi:hypothetical protein